MTKDTAEEAKEKRRLQLMAILKEDNANPMGVAELKKCKEDLLRKQRVEFGDHEAFLEYLEFDNFSDDEWFEEQQKSEVKAEILTTTLIG